MKRLGKGAALLLALVLCLSLVACGGDAPDKLKTIVIDDSVEYDYSVFLGTWLGEKDTVLVFWKESQEDLEEAGVERKGRIYYTLSDANDNWIASGLLQYSEEYGCVYAHNDYDGHAYKCQFGEDNTLNISSFGAFTKVSGDVPGETIGDQHALAPSIIDSLAIDDSVEYDYSVFLGTWLGEDDSVLAAEKYDDGRVYYTLSDANNDWIAGGLFQYVGEYDSVYAHNDYDGFSYLCSFNEDNTLNISSFSGTFTKVSGDVPGETIGDEFDLTVLTGKWNLDGDEDAAIIIEITNGSWILWEQGDGMWCPVDDGSIRAMGDGHCEALSENFELVHDVYLIGDSEIQWDDFYFQKME